MFPACHWTKPEAWLRQGNEMWVANAGDSRAVLARGGVAVALSEDHKPAAAGERARITAAGGFISDVGGVSRCAPTRGMLRCMNGC